MDGYQILFVFAVLLTGFFTGIIVKYCIKGVPTFDAIIIGFITPFLLIRICIGLIWKYWAKNKSKISYKLKKTFQAFYVSCRALPILIGILGESLSSISYNHSHRPRFQNEYYTIKCNLPKFNSLLRKKMAI